MQKLKKKKKKKKKTTILNKNEKKDESFCFAHLCWCHGHPIFWVMDQLKYWMPIQYDTMEDWQNKNPLLSHSHSSILELSKAWVTVSNCRLCTRTGRGHLYLKLHIILVKKIHVIRVVFQDQAMYARTSFRGAKTCKIGKKGVLLVIGTNFGKDMGKLRKTHAKCVFRVYFHTWKIRV